MDDASFSVTRVQRRHTLTCSSDVDLVEDVLQLYDNIFDLLGQIVSGQETWNGHRGSGGGSILSMLPIEHYLVHANTIYGERGI